VRIMNILFLGAGKRVSLVEGFLFAAQELGVTLNISSYEIDANQPVATISKVIVGKSWKDPGVSDDILRVMTEEEIDILISNVDPAVSIHSELSKISPAASFTSSPVATEICQSKILFQEFCEAKGLKIIPRAEADVYPYFRKPEFGAASIGAQLVSNASQESESYSKEIRQRYIEGIEYSVDAYISRTGEILGISPRVRISTLGGEVSESMTIADDEIVERSKEVIKVIGLVGPVTIQFIRESTTADLFLMEVNPRFGGGAVLSIAAGFNFPKLLLLEALGKKLEPIESGKNLTMRRYFKEHYFESSY